MYGTTYDNKGRHNAKSPGDLAGRGFCCLIGQLPTLPHTRACSTIGAGRLNFRVRDGNGWIPLATVTQKSSDFRYPRLSASICEPIPARILTGDTTSCFALAVVFYSDPKPSTSPAPRWPLASGPYSVSTVKFYGQAERAISSSQLNVLLRLHICPINVVVFHGPS